MRNAERLEAAAGAVLVVSHFGRRDALAARRELSRRIRRLPGGSSIVVFEQARAERSAVGPVPVAAVRAAAQDGAVIIPVAVWRNRRQFARRPRLVISIGCPWTPDAGQAEQSLQAEQARLWAALQALVREAVIITSVIEENRWHSCSSKVTSLPTSRFPISPASSSG